MRVKQVLCMLLTLTLLFSVPVYGTDMDEYIPGIIESEYKNMDYITASINISGGVATCSGKYEMTQNRKSVLELTLQRRPKSGGAYSEYASWSKENSGKSTYSLVKEKSVTKGYEYRVRTVVKVYSGSDIIEAGAYYSNTITY